VPWASGQCYVSIDSSGLPYVADADSVQIRHIVAEDDTDGHAWDTRPGLDVLCSLIQLFYDDLQA
jgi:hypothetical protein